MRINTDVTQKASDLSWRIQPFNLLLFFATFCDLTCNVGAILIILKHGPMECPHLEDCVKITSLPEHSHGTCKWECAGMFFLFNF